MILVPILAGLLLAGLVDRLALEGRKVDILDPRTSRNKTIELPAASEAEGEPQFSCPLKWEGDAL
jgi:hypothetical protein